MITAEKLTQLVELDRYELTNILAQSGYKDCKLDAVQFLGMTNGGQFCYKVDYFDEHTGEDDTGKVFVKFDHSTHTMTADF